MNDDDDDGEARLTKLQRWPYLASALRRDLASADMSSWISLSLSPDGRSRLASRAWTRQTCSLSLGCGIRFDRKAGQKLEILAEAVVDEDSVDSVLSHC